MEAVHLAGDSRRPMRSQILEPVLRLVIRIRDEYMNYRFQCIHSLLVTPKQESMKTKPQGAAMMTSYLLKQVRSPGCCCKTPSLEVPVCRSFQFSSAERVPRLNKPAGESTEEVSAYQLHQCWCAVTPAIATCLTAAARASTGSG